MSKQPPVAPSEPSPDEAEWRALNGAGAATPVATDPDVTPSFTIDKATLERLETRLGYTIDIPTRD